MTKQSAACRAVLYLRLSRDDDNRGESESIQNQRALLGNMPRGKASL